MPVFDRFSGIPSALTPVRPSTFDPAQAVEAILYIAERLKRPTVHEILKICYFGDKQHMSLYGSTATGDDYFAMQWGPVASETYNLLKAARGDEDRWVKACYLPLVAGAFDVYDNKKVRAKRGARLDYLAESARRAFDWAIQEYGDIDFRDRTASSHDGAWKRAWASKSSQDGDRAVMLMVDIAGDLRNCPEVLEYLHS